MDSRITFKAKIILLSIFVFLVIPNFTLGQSNSAVTGEISEKAIENYIAGIQSDNPGLKMSCIYFAGQYLLKDASPLLIREFKNTDDESLAVIIAWSLFKIGDKASLDELKIQSADHPSSKLKQFCISLCELKAYEENLLRFRNGI